jgi:tetratricopeptide (TPR) repeat protein
MIKIFIFIFSLLSLLSLQASSREEKKKLEEEIFSLMKLQNFNEASRKLESFIEKYPYEKKMVLNFARTLLRKKLEEPKQEEDPFLREQKFKQIQDNYKLASQIFEKTLKEWIELDPNEKNLGVWIFEWGLAEHLLGKKDRALQIYLLATKYPNYPKETYYNIAILKEELRLSKEATRYFKLYQEKINQ